MLRGGLTAAAGDTAAVRGDGISASAGRRIFSDATSIAVQVDDPPAHRVAQERGTLDAFGAEVCGSSARRPWMRRYQGTLIILDAVAGALSALLALFAFPRTAEVLAGSEVVLACALPAVWVGAVGVNRAYEAKFVGVGSTEFSRVFRAFLHTTVGVVFITFVAKQHVTRSFVVIAMGLILCLSLVLRYAARKRLHRSRLRGCYLTSVLAVGSADAVMDFAKRMARDRHAGMNVIGACVVEKSPEAIAELDSAGIAVFGDVDCIVGSVTASAADTVVVLSGEVSPQRLRWIAWQLEDVQADLVVTSGLSEIAGRRLHVQPVAGLPLLHVDQPEFTGLRRAVKGAFDRMAAALLIVALSPLLAGLGLAVRVTSQGPALFRQVRVGARGTTFTLYKFRSMVCDAESQLDKLAQHNESDGVLFKIKDDPRVTRVGAVLRKFSLDELPQLLNVVKGEMSLVGPRPPLPREVDQYGDAVRRRLLVKPGITGLWQISGRSDLTWEESVRLDLHYVENWSLALDMLVLWKTVRAVAQASGAY